MRTNSGNTKTMLNTMKLTTLGLALLAAGMTSAQTNRNQIADLSQVPQLHETTGPAPMLLQRVEIFGK